MLKLACDPYLDIDLSMYINKTLIHIVSRDPILLNNFEKSERLAPAM